jgi:hypothetical protein
MEERIQLVRHGKQLWTRETARKIRGEVEGALEKLGSGDVAVIDAKGVDVFDYSFANELFGRTMLALPREYPGRFVVVENLTGYTRENLVRALEGMNIAMLERTKKGPHLIGKFHPSDQATFDAITTHGEGATASMLSEKLKVGLNAMNERLSKLVGLGVVRRESATSPAGREHYEYHVPE